MKRNYDKKHQNIYSLLGMKQGTAVHRLRKMILFDLCKRLKENWCFRCGKEIKDHTDFTIDHKKPWYKVSANLFWDLKNIAFAHSHCNFLAQRGHGHLMRKVGRKGTAWCTFCKRFRKIKFFRKNRSHWNGLHTVCNPCDFKRRKEKSIKTHL